METTKRSVGRPAIDWEENMLALIKTYMLRFGAGSRRIYDMLKADYNDLPSSHSIYLKMREIEEVMTPEEKEQYISVKKRFYGYNK